MTRRLHVAATVVPLLLVACADSTSTPGGSSGGSSDVSNVAASGSSGVAGASVAGATAGLAGASGAAASGHTPSGGLGGTSANVGAGTAGVSLAGGAGESTSAAGTAGVAGGIPGGWIVVADVDYSMVPGPNFETVRLMFAGSPCSGSNCHFGGRNHLQVGKPADDLYRYMMSFKTLECGKLIDTANPSQSALVKYLRGPCGGIERMPSFKCFDDGDEACVPEHYIQAIEQWIAKGAPR
jgi:hypothetical protein